MDYLFRLADGRRVALWSEKNQIIRQLSGGGSNRSYMTLRTDFLSDFSAASLEGKIYFTYQNTSRRVMLYLPDGEEDRLLFGESIESCRHSNLTLIAWNGELYLFYTAWSPIKEKYALKVRKPLEGGTQGDVAVYAGGEETILEQELDEVPVFQVIPGQSELWVIAGEDSWRLTSKADGAEGWQRGVWTAAEKVDRWEELSREAEKTREKCLEMTSEQKCMTEKMKEMNAERKTLLNENERLQTERDQLKHENADFQEEIQRLSEECEKYQLETQRARDDLKAAQAENSARLQSAVTQYNDLAEVARQLQIEGKKWRDKYYHETKKRK